MARKLELKTRMINGDATRPTEKFDYGEYLKKVAGFAPRERGVVLGEVLAALGVIRPIEAAIAAGASSVILTDEQWRLLRDKNEIFIWGIVDEIVGEFGLMIREAPEIMTEAPGNG